MEKAALHDDNDPGFRQVESYLQEAERQLALSRDPATLALAHAIRALAAITQRLAARGEAATKKD